MMDISDGLLLDAFRMAEASEATFAIEAAAVPVASADRRDECMRWGDDYELLFTVREGAECPVPASRIGTVEPLGFAPLVLDGHPLVNQQGLGFQHG
jgi:thiamine-monophosphate kinase